MPLSHDRRVFLYAMLGGAPAVLVSLWILWGGAYSFNSQITLTVLILACWFGFAAAAHERVVRPLQTAANLLSALREGDYSIRAHGARYGDPMGELYSEINSLSTLLRSQRLSAMEATALVQAVMEAIDVSVFAFDAGGRLRLANPAGQRLLGSQSDRILGCSAAELGLAECLEGEAVRVLATSRFPGASGRWGMRRTSFREQGLPHSLVVIADLSQALRAEETKAWQRLVRVLGHELNNSLAPIKSIAGSLGTLFRRQPRAPDWEEDMLSGLDIISTRAEGLTRFMQAYSHLAKLPPPSLASTRLEPLLRRVAALDTRLTVTVLDSPDCYARIDSAQIEQALVNLLKNAIDATIEASSASGDIALRKVQLSWKKTGNVVEIDIEDDGIGIANPTNLFVPFFTTKREGSGIGLVLCRQIAENHNGSLTLENRTPPATGSVARLRIPV
jgi:two-component system, NtrC family, nitrogen regulation sensor histidine kinase NtrY